MNTIVGTNLTNEAWLQAQLPASQSGIGIRSAFTHSSSAYLASVLESEVIVSELLNEGRPEIANVDVALDHSLESLTRRNLLLRRCSRESASVA